MDGWILGVNQCAGSSHAVRIGILMDQCVTVTLADASR